MLSEHELVVAVRDDIYPKVKEIEGQCLSLFNKQFFPGRGLTGLPGSNELVWTIGYLKSAASLLERVAKEHGIDVDFRYE